MQVIKNAIYIGYKDMLEFTRSKIRLVMTIIMPFFMMIMTGSIYPSESGVKNIPIGLVVEEPSPSSDLIVNSINTLNDEKSFFEIKKFDSEAEIESQVKEGKIDGGLIISKEFNEDLMSGKQGEVIIFQDDTNPQISSVLTGVFNQIVDQVSFSVAVKNVSEISQASGQENSANPLSIVKPYITKTKSLLGGETNYFQFVAPGTMMMVVLMGIMTGLPRAISFERESGTLDGLLAAPISTMSIIIGKTLAQIIRGIIQATVILLLSIFLFGVTINGSILLVFFLLFIGVYSITGLGIALTSLAPDQEAATMLISTIMFPMMFLSGIFFPVEQMPPFAQAISKILPLTYSIDSLRKVITLGAGIGDLTSDIIILLVFGTVMLFVAVPLFKKMMTK